MEESYNGVEQLTEELKQVQKTAKTLLAVIDALLLDELGMSLTDEFLVQSLLRKADLLRDQSYDFAVEVMHDQEEDFEGSYADALSRAATFAEEMLSESKKLRAEHEKDKKRKRAKK